MLGWAGLPVTLVELLSVHYPTPRHLAAAFDTEGEAKQLVEEVAGHVRPAEVLSDDCAALLTWKQQHQALLGRLHRAAAQRAAWRGAATVSGATSASAVLLREGAVLQVPSPLVPRVTRWRARHRQALAGAGDPQERQQLEHAERLRWARRVVSHIRSADLPAPGFLAEGGENDYTGLSPMGSRRANTRPNQVLALSPIHI